MATVGYGAANRFGFRPDAGSYGRSEYGVSGDLNMEQDENYDAQQQQQQQQEEQQQQHEYETTNSGYKSDTSAIARPAMSEFFDAVLLALSMH
eukprot:16738-Heterococcus_DN1.PRE.7